MTTINKYLTRCTAIGSTAPSLEMLRMLTELEQIRKVSPGTATAIVRELADQRGNLKLIASENYSSPAVQAAMGTLLTDKYAEGFPFHRFYAGCDNVDMIEAEACEHAKMLFHAEHAYVQPHSGADANLCAYWAILNHCITMPALLHDFPVEHTKVDELTEREWTSIREACHNQRLLGLDYYSGGHLTHGYRQNISAQLFECHSYAVNEETGLLDYDEIQKIAEEVRPLILLAGYSAYPRKIDFRRMADIAHSVGAVFMVDMAHFAGLVAGGVFKDEYSPFPWADVVTTTTHKTLRGPRGGLILCKQEFADDVDKGCPLVIGGPLPHVIAAKNVAIQEALDPSFAVYAENIVENASAMADEFINRGAKVLTGGTDNHLMLIDVTKCGHPGLTGRSAERLLRDCGITVNRNAIPNDPNGPWYTSGLRLGTPAVTTLGMNEEDMKEIADIIMDILSNARPVILTKGKNAGKASRNQASCPADIMKQAADRVHALLAKYVLYPEIDLKFLEDTYLPKED